jgi:hypothetical protein
MDNYMNNMIPIERWQDSSGRLFWPGNVSMLGFKIMKDSKPVAKWFIKPKPGYEYSSLNRIN